MTLRQRFSKDPLKVVRQLDAFPKVSVECQQSSRIGGTLSIISRALIIYLIFNETMYYMDSKLVFRFKPDTDMDTKLKIHIDITVATPCSNIGADILDSTNQNVFSFGLLEEQDTWWELDLEQRTYFDYTQHLNAYLREEYHSLNSLIFKDMLHKGSHKTAYNLPERTIKPNKPFDACRVHGSLTLNKVAGNFHITGGKSIHFASGHIHIQNFFDEVPLNFSHRINRFSFGDSTSGIVHPLEGDEKILTDSSTQAQYFIEVVPTDIYSFMSHVKTYQYSVKENIRPINHSKGAHGMPGLYFKYDVSALKVIVRQDHENFMHFLIRLSSVIAGIIVSVGYLNSLIQLITDFFISKVSPQTYQQLHNSNLNPIIVDEKPQSNWQQPQQPNNLISNANQMVDTNNFNFAVKQ
ncbi:endoplasmic reticulum-Golgi intermediate compartment protein 2 [Contarinia nasturtii]|uniref:endoplasmic reticulum-Golgi intermediate compartment protein 2 n=1 Tax=Contarinia nasturtii TaxID=265458 RepID=UPI0012D48A9B|nr:endoplasmic reticulum-Golgi intermediate compartment protein 2 [Contarinia nasturtii]